MTATAPLRRYSITTSLVGLVTACLAPAVLVSAALVQQNYRLQRERIDRDTVLLARNLGAALDRELAGVESGLRVLATSPELAARDLAGFHRRASEALRFQIVDNYVMTDRSGRQYVNTLRPWGEPLPTTGAPAELRRVFETGRPVLTGLFTGPVTHAPVIAMGVPVFRGDEVVYSLNVGMSPQRIAAILARQALPEGWLAVVIDGSGTVVARTRDPQRFVGGKAAPSLVEAARAQREGTLEVVTLEGIPVYSAFSRALASDWSVAVAAPADTLRAELGRSIAWAVAGAAAAFGAALWMATRLTRRVSSSVRALIEPALSLGSGASIELPRTRLKEADAVGHAMLEASRMLEQTRRLAHHDALTGLPNRLLFDELAASRIAEARRHGAPLAMLAIDLDGFKAVNDTHGHAMGDRVLKLAADRISTLLRASDVVARLGGDEFAVVLGDTGMYDAQRVGGKLVAALAEPYPDVLPRVSASVGIAMYPQSGDSVADLCARADSALYAAKSAGKQRVAVDG